MEAAGDKQHGGETNRDAKHLESPGLISCLNGKAETAGRDCYRPTATSGDQKIFIALSSVFHTPHASGMPTKAQNSAALTSRPPLPMTNEPECTAAELFALAACTVATSSP